SNALFLTNVTCEGRLMQVSAVCQGTPKVCRLLLFPALEPHQNCPLATTVEMSPFRVLRQEATQIGANGIERERAESGGGHVPEAAGIQIIAASSHQAKGRVVGYNWSGKADTGRPPRVGCRCGRMKQARSRFIIADSDLVSASSRRLLK